MRRATLALLALLLAGCATPATDAPPGEGAPMAPLSERPETTFTDVAPGDAAPPDAGATLDAPPKLRAGEWWRIRFESPYTEPTEFVRVVARAEPDGTYLVGMPHEGWWKEAVVFHTPGLGGIGADLSYAAHDVPFTPLVFPLTAETTWETHWEDATRPLTARVELVDERTAEVTLSGATCGLAAPLIGCDETQPSQQIRLRYDATQHEVVRFEAPGILWEVVEHGYDFEGWVTIPRDEALVFLHGRVGPALDFDLQPAGPTDTVEVAGGFNRASFILTAGGIAPASGVFMERATAPDGTVHELTALPGEGLRIAFLETASPDGTWTFEHLAAGAGVALAEGVAYHQYDIHLPSGAIRTDHDHEVVR